jgi:hypothetical protein
MVPQMADVWSRIFSKKKQPAAAMDPERQQFLRLAAALICLLFVWCGFALSTVSQPLLGGTPRSNDNLFSSDTPHGITKYLREHPPEGLVFAPQWWGDWISWDGPTGIQLFMTTNLHLTPRRVWRDYLTIGRGQAGWEQLLDKYNVQTLVVHNKLQTPLVRALRRSANWKKVYEDSLGMVLQRASST